MWLPATLLALVPILVIGILALVLVWATRSKREVSGPVRAPIQGGAPYGVDGRWNLEILGDNLLGALGGSIGATYGVLDLRGGYLTFTIEGARAPAWSVPCTHVSAVGSGWGVFAPAALTLTGPMGTLRCNVSLERFNRILNNDFKDVREARTAKGFLAALAANGARVS